MIGLEYICHLFQMQSKVLAARLGITPTAVSTWLRGKKKIPKARLTQLSLMFGITESLLQKEINEEDRDDIDLIYFKRQSEEDRVEIPSSFIDDDGVEYVGTVSIDPYERVVSIIEERTERRRQKQRLLADIADLISSGSQEQDNFLRFRIIANLLKTKGQEDYDNKILLLDICRYFIGLFPDKELKERVETQPLFKTLKKLFEDEEIFE